MTNGTGWKETFLNEKGERGEGFTPEQEEKFFDDISERIREVVKHFSEDNGRPMRANHAKILAGFTDAEFRVSPDIPADLAVGFLSEPGKVYKAIVRFSNASSEFTGNDSKQDLRGVAVRVLAGGEKPREHDFLMTSAEQHHAVDAREAMAAIRAGVVKDKIVDLVPGESRIEEKLGGAAAGAFLLAELKDTETVKRIGDTLDGQLERPVMSLATETYFSRAPLAVGQVPDPQRSVAVKYFLAPAVPPQGEASEREPDLGGELRDRLSRGEVRFLFKVQRFINEARTPIEDATKKWSEASPITETIAELVIPRGAEFRNEEVDRIPFSPWHIDTENFQPLGSMNRSRKKVYAASVEERTK